MLAKEVMHTNVLTGKPENSIQELIRMMLNFNVSMLPIVDDNLKVLGVVTEGDIIYRAYSDGEPVDVGVAFLGKLREMIKSINKRSGTTAREVMTEELFTASEDTPISEIASMMVREKIKNVPILADGKLVGLVSRRDIMRLVMEGKL